MQFTHARGSSDYISKLYIIRKISRTEWLVLDADETDTLAAFTTYTAARQACEYTAARQACEDGLAVAPTPADAEPTPEPTPEPEPAVQVVTPEPAPVATVAVRRPIGVGAWRMRYSDEHGEWDAQHSQGLRVIIVRTPGHPPSLWAHLRQPHRLGPANCPHWQDLEALAAAHDQRLTAEERYAAAQAAPTPTPSTTRTFTLRVGDSVRVLGGIRFALLSIQGMTGRFAVDAPGDVMRAETMHGVIIDPHAPTSPITLGVFPTQNTAHILAARVTLTLRAVIGTGAIVSVEAPEPTPPYVVRAGEVPAFAGQ